MSRWTIPCLCACASACSTGRRNSTASRGPRGRSAAPAPAARGASRSVSPLEPLERHPRRELAGRQASRPRSRRRRRCAGAEGGRWSSPRPRTSRGTQRAPALVVSARRLQDLERHAPRRARPARPCRRRRSRPPRCAPRRGSGRRTRARRASRRVLAKPHRPSSPRLDQAPADPRAVKRRTAGTHVAGVGFARRFAHAAARWLWKRPSRCRRRRLGRRRSRWRSAGSSRRATAASRGSRPGRHTVRPRADLRRLPAQRLGVARTHAAIRWAPGAVPMLRDLDSTNGVFVNARRVRQAPAQGPRRPAHRRLRRRARRAARRTARPRGRFRS